MKNKKFITTFAIIGALTVGVLGVSNKIYANTTKMITESEAKNIALKEVPNGQVTKLKLDQDHGRMVYEIEVIEGTTEKEFDIDAYNGQIIKIDTDYNKHYSTISNPQISLEDAKKIVLQNSKNAIIESIELDNRFGKSVYEIETIENFIEKDYIIDAKTGEILNIKKDF